MSLDTSSRIQSRTTVCPYSLQLITMSVPVSEHEVVRIFFRMQSRGAAIFSSWKIERYEIVRTNFRIQSHQIVHTSSRIQSRETVHVYCFVHVHPCRIQNHECSYWLQNSSRENVRANSRTESCEGTRLSVPIPERIGAFQWP